MLSGASTATRPPRSRVPADNSLTVADAAMILERHGPRADPVDRFVDEHGQRSAKQSAKPRRCPSGSGGSRHRAAQTARPARSTRRRGDRRGGRSAQPCSTGDCANGDGQKPRRRAASASRTRVVIPGSDSVKDPSAPQSKPSRSTSAPTARRRPSRSRCATRLSRLNGASTGLRRPRSRACGEARGSRRGRSRPR